MIFILATERAGKPNARNYKRPNGFQGAVKSDEGRWIHRIRMIDRRITLVHFMIQNVSLLKCYSARLILERQPKNAAQNAHVVNGNWQLNAARSVITHARREEGNIAAPHIKLKVTKPYLARNYTRSKVHRWRRRRRMKSWNNNQQLRGYAKLLPGRTSQLPFSSYVPLILMEPECLLYE